jgi:hypothetical protein
MARSESVEDEMGRRPHEVILDFYIFTLEYCHV